MERAHGEPLQDLGHQVPVRPVGDPHSLGIDDATVWGSLCKAESRWMEETHLAAFSVSWS